MEPQNHGSSIHHCDCFVEIVLAKAKAEGDELTATHCQLIASFTGLGVRPMPTKSPQAANQIHDQHDKQDRSNDPKASAHPPPGITVVSSASTEQQNQKDN
jgi:hypothetical protein